MPTPYTRLLSRLLLAVSLCAIPSLARAEDGAIRLATDRGAVYVVARPHGGVFVALSGQTGLRLFATLPSGLRDPAWPVEGRLLTGTTGYPASLAADNSGGVYVGWTRPVGGTWRALLGRYKSDGSPAIGWPDSGLAVGAPPFDTNYAPSDVSVVPDLAGGAYIAWSASNRIRVSRYQSGGVLAVNWPAAGVELAPAYATPQTSPALVRDPSTGGVFVAWLLSSGGTGSYVVAQRLKADGTPATGWSASGVLVTQSSNARYGPVAISDGLGGAFLSWNEAHNPGGWHAYVSHVAASGSRPWNAPDGTVLLAQGGDLETPPSITSDGAGGIFSTWFDGSSSAVPFEHVYSSGGRFMGLGGLPIASVPARYPIEVCASDGQLGAYVLWIAFRDLVSQTKDLRLVRVDGDANPIGNWPAEGVLLASGSLSAQYFYKSLGIGAVADSAGGVYAVWSNVSSDSGNTGLFIRRVLPDGSFPSTLGAPPQPGGFTARQISVSPSVAFGPVRIRLSAASSGPIQVLDANGRILRTLLAAGGAHSEQEWDLLDSSGGRVQPGLYFVRSLVSGASVSARVVVLR